MAKFRKYEKVVRLGTQETAGILEGTCYIFPKLDGTNASMWWDHETHSICYGSRNRHLSADDDNAGFMNWGLTQNKYSKYMVQTKGRYTLYGEWLVPHTIKGYADEYWRDFYIFDVYDNKEDRYLTYHEYQPAFEAMGLPYLRPIIMENPSMEAIEACLSKQLQAYCKEGEEGEGIVIKNYNYTNKYGRQVYGKYIRDKFMDKKKKVVTDCPIETEIAEHCVSRDLVVKVATKIVVDTGMDWTNENKGKHIPRLLETVYHDVITEKLWDELKRLKQPTVSFGRLRGQVIQVIKREGKEYF